jgi:galactokinase
VAATPDEIIDSPLGARARALALLGRPPAVVARAPGRVNLIGEHTDYNDGFVLPMALPFDTVIAAVPNAAGCGIDIESEGFGVVHVDPAAPLDGERDWSIHLRGVHAVLADEGVPLSDWSGVVATDIPMGASLSSSAALEVACASVVLALAQQADLFDGRELALLGQRVENDVLGLPSGIMDQLISATARAGHASLIDCRSLQAVEYPLPTEAAVIVMDTLTRRELIESEYADRRADCAEAALRIGVPALRDARIEDLVRLNDDRLRRRAHHVVTENQRAVDAAAAMGADDAATLGELMNASHRSLRDDYEVSGPGLDAIVDVAWSAPGCLGARMTGGGFAGCAVALVDVSAVDEFMRVVEAGYHVRTGQRPALWPVEPSPGASAELM